MTDRILRGTLPVLIALLTTFLLPPRQATAQQQVPWNHGECTAAMDLSNPACTPLRTVNADPGETITLTITNTCPDDFTYAVVPLLAPPRAELQAGASPKSCTGTKTVDIRHDPQYGGYIVNVVRKAEANVAAGNARITLAVRTSEWRLGFAGGFTLNGLVDPAYALRPVAVTAGATTTTRYRLVEQDSRKDAVGRSVVSYVHLHHSAWERSRWPTPAISFGLGVEPDRGGDYYFGLSALFGDRAALTGGFVAGRVQSPPSGREVGDTLDDANALNNLGRRRKGTLFIGLSYRFLGGGANDLKKPFQGQSPPATPGASTAAGTTAGAGLTPPAANAVEKADGDNQTVKAGTKSATFAIRAPWAPGGGVRWSAKAEDQSPYQFAGPTNLDEKGVGSYTVTIGTAAPTGKVTLRASVCRTDKPTECGEALFTVTVTAP